MDTLNDQTPFTLAGQCHDEVKFTFDNTDTKLFVSGNFLSLVSPVFRTMYTSEFIEKSTGVVEMKGKEYDDVLEFLLVLHPCVKKPITAKNVYVVLSMAEHYQVDILVTESKALLRNMLADNFKVIEADGKSELLKTEAAYSCLQVLSTAALYRYQDVKDMALTTISKFGSKVFLNEVLLMTNGHVYNEEEWKIEKNNNRIGSVRNRGTTQFTPFFGETGWTENMADVVSKRKVCTDAFNKLPDDIKFKLMQNRLDKLEDSKIKN